MVTSFVSVQVHGGEPEESVVLSGGKPGELQFQFMPLVYSSSIIRLSS